MLKNIKDASESLFQILSNKKRVIITKEEEIRSLIKTLKEYVTINTVYGWRDEKKNEMRDEQKKNEMRDEKLLRRQSHSRLTPIEEINEDDISVKEGKGGNKKRSFYRKKRNTKNKKKGPSNRRRTRRQKKRTHKKR